MIKDATQEDLDWVRNNPYDEKYVKQFKDFPLTGWSKTWIIDDKIIMVGGVVQYWQGFGEGWFCLSKYAKNYKIKVINFLRFMIQEVMKELSLNRLQVTVMEDLTQAMKLDEFLGFKCETPEGMKRYSPDGKTAYLFSITR